MIEIVSATRRSEADFWEKSALGLSLRRLAFDKRMVVRVAYENKRGLPVIYNAALASNDGSDILVFIHDDVWLDDYFFADRLMEGLKVFDVIGVAGNRRIVKGQTAWAFVDTQLTWDARHNLSGLVAHGNEAFGTISYFGPVPAACELLDGVFLAARKERLRKQQVWFDPRFDFHFYDMDFCRAARAAGLRLGTWPICLTHQSEGAFGTAPWRLNFERYRAKWDE